MRRESLVKSAAFLCLILLFATPVWAQHHGGGSGGHGAGDGTGHGTGHGKGHGGGHGQDAQAVILETITVQAEKIEAYIQNHPRHVTVVNRAEIEERNFRSVAESLNSMPGVDVRPSAGLGSRISIRGSGRPGGVRVLLNGRPLNASQYGGVDLSTIPVELVESITVFKPPAPVWLGPGASEGAIAIVTRDFAPGTGDDDGGATRVRLGTGSHGHAEGSVRHVAKWKSGGAMASASGSRRDGKRPNSDRDKGVFSLHWDHQTETTVQYEINGRYYASESGSSGPTDNPTPDARQEYQKLSADLGVTGFLGGSGEYELKLYGDRTDLRDQSQSGFVSDLENVAAGAKADATWAGPDGEWEFRLGTLLSRDEVDHTLSGRHHRVALGLHGQCDRSLGPFTLTLGARGDHTGDFGFQPGASGGLGHAATERLLLKANAGYAVNVPTFGQLYQPAHGSIDQSRGNPDLEEERVANFDLGLEYRRRKDRVFQAALFRSDTRDLIVYRRGDDRIYRPENADRAWRHGIELSVEYAVRPGLNVDISYILQDSENRETGQELAYTPRHEFKTTLQCTLPFADTRLETTVRGESEQFSESGARPEWRLGDFVTADLQVLQPVEIGGMDGEVWLNLINLFDRDFEFHHGYPDDGLRFVAGVNWDF